MRTWLLALPLVLSSCPQQCAPAAHTISWEGRSPVGYVTIPLTDAASQERVQDALDAGNAVEIGREGHRHVAGHFHGVFAAGPNLDPGDEIQFDGAVFVVTGTVSAHAGDPPVFPAGLTVQYSGCGGVCLVRAQPR